MNLRRIVRDIFGERAAAECSSEREAHELLLDRRSFLAASLVAALTPAPKAYSFLRPRVLTFHGRPFTIRERVHVPFWDTPPLALPADDCPLSMTMPDHQRHVTLHPRVFEAVKGLLS